MAPQRGSDARRGGHFPSPLDAGRTRITVQLQEEPYGEAEAVRALDRRVGTDLERFKAMVDAAQRTPLRC